MFKILNKTKILFYIINEDTDNTSIIIISTKNCKNMLYFINRIFSTQFVLGQNSKINSEFLIT